MKIAWILGIWLLTASGLYVLVTRWLNWSRSRLRLGEREIDARDVEEAPAVEDLDQGLFGLRRWLVQSGYRGRGAPAVFLATAATCLVVGALAAYLILATGGVARGFVLVEAIPGAVGDLLGLILILTPWLTMLVLASVPWVYVRAKRRTRVQSVEMDLPITLELLATLAQAGLGFDAAIAKLLESEPESRPLPNELRLYQLEVMTGLQRIQCLRRLSARIGVPGVSTFVSAIVQAEQVGAAMADVLQRQADDLRNRRRENAMALAQSVPVKLTIPLVICFLPGIFVTTLGPTFYQFFQLAETVMRDLE